MFNKIAESAFVDELEKLSGKNVIGRFIDRVRHGSNSIYAAKHDMPEGLAKNIAAVEEALKNGPKRISEEQARIKKFMDSLKIK